MKTNALDKTVITTCLIVMLIYIAGWILGSHLKPASHSVNIAQPTSSSPAVTSQPSDTSTSPTAQNPVVTPETTVPATASATQTTPTPATIRASRRAQNDD
jgi:hypothetical protein